MEPASFTIRELPKMLVKAGAAATATRCSEKQRPQYHQSSGEGESSPVQEKGPEGDKKVDYTVI